jgi:hypothetical protein
MSWGPDVPLFGTPTTPPEDTLLRDCSMVCQNESMPVAASNCVNACYATGKQDGVGDNLAATAPPTAPRGRCNWTTRLATQKTCEGAGCAWYEGAAAEQDRCLNQETPHPGGGCFYQTPKQCRASEFCYYSGGTCRAIPVPIAPVAPPDSAAANYARCVSFCLVDGDPVDCEMQCAVHPEKQYGPDAFQVCVADYLTDPKVQPKDIQVAWSHCVDQAAAKSAAYAAGEIVDREVK